MPSRLVRPRRRDGRRDSHDAHRPVGTYAHRPLRLPCAPTLRATCGAAHAAGGAIRPAGSTLSYVCPTTSHTSTLTNVAGAAGISRRRLNVASACRAFSSVSKSQKECGRVRRRAPRPIGRARASDSVDHRHAMLRDHGTSLLLVAPLDLHTSDDRIHWLPNRRFGRRFDANTTAGQPERPRRL